MGNRLVTIRGHEWKLGEKLGEGAFGNVWEVTDAGKSVGALKIMRVDNANTITLSISRTETRILTTLPAHPNIIQLLDHEVTDDGEYTTFNLVLELCTGGSAADALIQRGDAGLTLPEDTIAAWFADMCAAVVHLHAQSPPIQHRDLKPEALLLADTSWTASTRGKLCDFGSCSTWTGTVSTARDISRMEDVIDRTTTLHFRAPELVDLHAHTPIGPPVDIWALGCTLFKLMFGHTPFEDPYGNAQRMGILAGKWSTPAQHQYSPELVALVGACLQQDPAKRPTAAELLAMGAQTVRAWPRDRVSHLAGAGSVRRPLAAATARAAGAVPAARPEQRTADSASTPTGATPVPQTGAGMRSRSGSHPKFSWSAAANTASLAVRTRFLQLMGGDAEKRRWVLKVTSPLTPGPPKLKYVRRLILDAYQQNSASTTYMSVPRLPLTSDPIVACKASVLILRLWQQGPPVALAESGQVTPAIADMVAAWEHVQPLAPGAHAVPAAGQHLCHFVHSLGSLLIAKAALHQECADFSPLFAARSDGGHTEALPLQGCRSPLGVVFHTKRSLVNTAVVSRLLSYLGTTVALHQELLSVAKPAVSAIMRWAGSNREHVAPVAGLSPESPVGHVEACLFGALQPLLRETWNAYKAAFGMLLVLRAGQLGAAPPATVLDALAQQAASNLVVLREVHRMVHDALAVGAHECLLALEGLPLLPATNPFEDDEAARAILGNTNDPGEQDGGMLDSVHGQAPAQPSPVAEGIPGVRWPVGSGETPGVLDAASDDETGYTPRSAASATPGKSPAGTPAAWSARPLPVTETATKRAALAQREDSASHRASAVSAILAAPENATCAECGAVQPKWASINLGITLCVQCSGAHRSLGVHLSQVRSLTLDTIKLPALRALLCVGNLGSNVFWEAKLLAAASPGGKPAKLRPFKPSSSSEMQDRIAFVRAKYQDRAFAPPGSTEADEPAARCAAGQSLQVWAPARAQAPAPVPAPAPAPVPAPAVASFANEPFDPFSAGAPSTAAPAAAPASPASFDLWGAPAPAAPAASNGAGQQAQPPAVPEANRDSFMDEFSAELAVARLASSSGPNQALALAPRKPSPAASPFPDSTDFADLAAAPEPAFEESPRDDSDDFLSSAFKTVEGVDDDVLCLAAPVPQIAAVEQVPVDRRASLAATLDALWTDDVEIPWEDITLGEKIGAGGFAEVYRGLWRGTEVAVKKLLHRPGRETDKAVADFKAEVSLMTRLRHPCIVLFMGVVPEPLSMVTEYCARGNLYDLLHSSTPLPWALRQAMALDVARGMNFLHTSTPIIMHRDLKSLNLLVDERWTVKVSDMGLSRFKAASSGAGLYTAQCGTLQWMAPEVVAGHRYTEKADVYSFGINLWELLTRETPFEGMQPMAVGMSVLNAGLRPTIPADAPPQYAALIRACWRADPTRRPSFAQIITSLQAMVKSQRAQPSP